MFHGLQVLHCVYGTQHARETFQLQQASSSTGAVSEKHLNEAFPEVVYQNWLDPERLDQDWLLKPLLYRSWINKKEPCYLMATGDEKLAHRLVAGPAGGGLLNHQV